MSLYIYESGPTSAPTVVLLPGGGVGGWSWTPQVAALADYHLLVPDLPDQGRSLDVGPFSHADAAGRVADLIRQRAHGGKAHVVGLSLGGQVTVQLLATTPEVVERAMVSGMLVHPLPGTSLIRPTIAAYMPFRNIPVLIRANMWSAAIPGRYYEQVREETAAMTTDAMTRVLVAGLNFRLPKSLERATAPTLVTVGEKEYGMMRRSARDILAALPNARGYIVKGVPHNWGLAAPDLFNRTLRAWLKDQPLPEALVHL